MTVRAFFTIAVSAAVALAAVALAAVALHAQAPAEPTAYSVTVKYQITGTALRTTHRLGSKVLVDQVPATGADPGAASGPPTRTLYLLDTGQSLTWQPANPAAACTRDSFQGDAWLDPFSGAADLAMPGVTQVGSETVLGIDAKILVSQAKPGFRLWVDPKTGLMLKAEFTPQPSAPAMTYFEVTEVHMQPPPAALFAVPAGCPSKPGASKTPPQN